MNKYLIAVAACAVSASVSASDASKNFAGFGIGLTAGYNTGSVNTTTGGTKTTTAAQLGAVAPLAGSFVRGTLPMSQKNNLSMKGFNGGLFVNYGWVLQKMWYVGLEAYGKLSNMEGNQEFAGARNNNTGNGFIAGDNLNSSIKAKHTNSFGAALRLGAIIKGNTLVYAKVGIESANYKFEANHSQATHGISNANALRTMVGGSKSRRLTGVPFGLGVEVAACEKLKLGLEVVHTVFNSTNVETSATGNSVYSDTANGGAATPVAGSGTISNKFKPRKTEVNLRVTYKI